MRMLNFAKRNFKELIRDPLSLIFEIALPIFLLFIFQQFNIPSDVFKLENFTPGIIIFGFSFISLFSGALVAKDRSTSLLIRLGTSPMKSKDFILGYIISLIPLVIIQDVLFFGVALLLGLSFSVNIIFSILISIIISILFISLGILIGSLVSEKASGGVGSIIVQLVCFTSGMYFSTSQVGKTFGIICDLLPFGSSLNIIKNIMNGNKILFNDVIVFSIWTILTIVIATIVFNRKMKSDNK